VEPLGSWGRHDGDRQEKKERNSDALEHVSKNEKGAQGGTRRKGADKGSKKAEGIKAHKRITRAPANKEKKKQATELWP